MVTKKQYLFIEALLVAAFLFSFGILIGVFIENARANLVGNNLAQLETEIMDARLVSNLINLVSCDIAKKETLDFADRVFLEAKTLDKFERSSEITKSIKVQHKKYDLLRAMIWVTSINIKERCGYGYHNVVYIYKYKNPSLTEKATQTVISNILSDIKDEKGDEVLLISMAGDNDLPSINLLLGAYNVTELPAIVIDEKIILTDIKNKEDIEKYLD